MKLMDRTMWLLVVGTIVCAAGAGALWAVAILEATR